MLAAKLSILLFVIIFFRYSKSNDSEDEYDDDEDNIEFDDCEQVIDFKTYKKHPKLELCDALKSPSLKSRIQLQIYSNYTEEKVHLYPILMSPSNSNINKSLITLTTDITENYKYSTSLLTIDNFQLISFSTLESIISSLINTDLNLLGKNLKKTLVITKGGSKQIFNCSGNYYPTQDIKILNIKSDFTKPITCTKDAKSDQFFILREKIYLDQNNQKNFNLVNIHQDDPKKISRTTWYTCNNPKACNNGLQNKNMLDKTVNYALKFLQKGPAQKKTPSG